MAIAMTPIRFGPWSPATALAQHRENSFDVFAHSFGMHVNGWIPAAGKM